MINDTEWRDLRTLCPEARYLEEGGVGFISLPGLRFPVRQEITIRDALLSLQAHTGYASRLYVDQPIPGVGQNWTCHIVFGRGWHTPSWDGVKPASPMEMLQGHLRVYRP